MIFCENFVFSYRFPALSQNFPTFSQRVFVGLVTSASYMSLGRDGGRMIFCRSFSSSYRFRTLGNIFWPSVEKFSLGFLKLHSTYPWKHSEGNYFLRKISIFFYHSGTLRKRTSGLLSETFRRGVKTASHMSSGTFGGRIVFCKTFSFSYRFLTLSKNFSTFCRQVFVEVVTTESSPF